MKKNRKTKRNNMKKQAKVTNIGTAVRMSVANIGNVTAGILQNRTGKMVINLTAGTIVISS